MVEPNIIIKFTLETLVYLRCETLRFQSGICRDKTMAGKLMYISNDDSQNYNWWLKRLDTQLNEPINQNSIKVPKVVKPINKKTLL